MAAPRASNNGKPLADPLLDGTQQPARRRDRFPVLSAAAAVLAIGGCWLWLRSSPYSGQMHVDGRPPVDPQNPPVRMPVSLPGVPTTAPYEYYSGFLDAGTPPSGRGKMFFHYICAMAPGWREKPLALWYNGGPGAPSTYGLFQEFGPFLLTAASYSTPAYRATGVPTPRFNPWTWANLTSLCEIDSPAPMGASYCTEGNGTAGSVGGPAGDPYSCGPWTDQSTAAANHKAHAAFFRDAFPEFEASQQPVTLVGESYAGVYVPLFADAWLADPIVGPKGKEINFYGFAVGDGFPACIPQPGKPVDWCVNLENVEFFRYPNALPGPHWDVEFFHGHSQMSEELYRRIKAGCTAGELLGKAAPLPPGDRCRGLLEEMAREVGFFHAYNLFEACPVEEDSGSVVLQATRRMISGSSASRRRQHVAPTVSVPVLPTPGDGDTGLGAPCLGSAMGDYFKLGITKRALGIPADNNFIALDNGKGMNYTTDAGFVGHVYKRAIGAGKRVLIYEGDSDACGLQTAPIEDIWAPFLSNGTGEADQWTPIGPLNTSASAPLRLPRTQPWRPFGLEPSGRKVHGGFSMAWNDGQVTFVSIRGAGHLAPLYRPAASFTMMRAFLAAEPLPPPFYKYPENSAL